MTKNHGREHHHKNPSSEAGAALFTDAETVAIIDAQCEEHKTSRARFIAVVTRLFLDFSYIAKTVGKDVFAFRDELIKAIVRSKGDRAPSEIIESMERGGARADKSGGGAGARESGLEGLEGKFAEMARELVELREAFVELKNTLGGHSHAGAGRSETKSGRHHAEETPAEESRRVNQGALTIDELAGEFRNSQPPSYKDKRKKLHKLKF